MLSHGTACRGCRLKRPSLHRLSLCAGSQHAGSSKPIHSRQALLPSFALQLANVSPMLPLRFHPAGDKWKHQINMLVNNTLRDFSNAAAAGAEGGEEAAEEEAAEEAEGEP